MTGKVIFVGAGTGSADLLTVRAARCLQQADVVLHDDLVSPDVLQLVSARAVVRSVGKRCGAAGISQQALNELMVAHARAGNRVVRLKSGDPAIFGRLGEEIEALREAGVCFEIVPGVTAGLTAAAAAHISLTDRRTASSVVFAAACLAHGKRQDWNALAATGATLVIYMPGREFALLAQELQAAGIAADVPCAVVSQAGGSDEATVSGTISELAQFKVVTPPSVVIVGALAGAREIAEQAVQAGRVPSM